MIRQAHTTLKSPDFGALNKTGVFPQPRFFPRRNPQSVYADMHGRPQGFPTVSTEFSTENGLIFRRKMRFCGKPSVERHVHNPFSTVNENVENHCGTVDKSRLKCEKTNENHCGNVTKSASQRTFHKGCSIWQKATPFGNGVPLACGQDKPAPPSNETKQSILLKNTAEVGYE